MNLSKAQNFLSEDVVSFGRMAFVSVYISLCIFSKIVLRLFACYQIAFINYRLDLKLRPGTGLSAVTD
jgi:hypothetical protein